MWILPLIAIGLVIYSAGRSARTRDEARVGRYFDPSCDRSYYLQPHRHQPRARRRVTHQEHVPPSPLIVLSDLAAAGRQAPPFVIMCAIAEAEARGRFDVASDIVNTFIVPVVRRHDAAAARASASETGSPKPEQPQLAPPPAAAAMTDEDLRAMLDEDPEKFLAMATGPGGVVPAEPALEEPPRPLAPIDTAEGRPVAPLMGNECPIDGVDLAHWDEFCARLAREEPTFQTSRHVGQYRQRKDRLSELGIDPARVAASSAAQRAALNIDLADACEKLREGGDVGTQVGRLLAIPGEAEPRAVTLSGLLGVAQVAGLEGCISWLENRGDRKKYPNTTAAFVRCNGVF